jgi:hypothetical protein
MQYEPGHTQPDLLSESSGVEETKHVLEFLERIHVKSI